jgi:hypothetical protein
MAVASTHEPSKAWKARSTSQLLAISTALTTDISIVGKASLRVLSACCRGLNGRGGFGGAAVAFCWAVAVDTEVIPDSWGSSSKSRGRAVVGDSGLGLYGPRGSLLVF